jgi:WD40 repeat protein
VPAITIWNRTTGESFNIGPETAGRTETMVFSHDGDSLAFQTEAGVPRIEVWSVGERRMVYQAEDFSWGPDFNAEGLLSYAFLPESDEGDEPSVRVVDPVSGQLVHTFPAEVGWTAWSPDGNRIAASDQEEAIVFDVASGAEVARTGTLGRLYRPEWLPDGDAFVVGGELNPRIIDAATGEVRVELLGLTGGTWQYDVVPGTTLLASASLAGEDTVIFDISQLGGVELGGWLAPIEIATADYAGDGERLILSDLFESYLTAGALDGSEARSLQGDSYPWRVEVSGNGSYVAFADPDGMWSVRASDTDEIVYRAPEGWAIRGVSRDGAQALIMDQEAEECAARLVSTVDGSTAAELDGGCTRGIFSSDGKLMFTATSEPGQVTTDISFLGQGVFDTETGELQGTALQWPKAGFEAAFTPDASKLVLGTWGGTVYIFDVALLRAGAPEDEAVIREIPAHDTSILRVSVSRDGSKAATWGQSEPVKVWDLDTGQLLGQFGGKIDDGFRDADFHPSLPQLIVTSPPNEVRIHTLDDDDLIAIAQSRLSRDMTEGECEQYFRRSCEGS